MYVYEMKSKLAAFCPSKQQVTVQEVVALASPRQQENGPQNIVAPKTLINLQSINEVYVDDSCEISNQSEKNAAANGEREKFIYLDFKSYDWIVLLLEYYYIVNRSDRRR